MYKFDDRYGKVNTEELNDYVTVAAPTDDYDYGYGPAAQANEVVAQDDGSAAEYEAVDPKEKFIIKVSDFKQSMGPWYSILGLRMLPFLLYVIPFNVVIGRAIMNIDRLFDVILPADTVMIIAWFASLLIFLAVAIVWPKAATVIEFLVGFAYLFFALRHHMFNSAVGIMVLIGVIIFLLVKLTFLVFAIMRFSLIRSDAEGVERDESGRVIRPTEEDVVFTDIVDDGGIALTDDEVVFTDALDDGAMALTDDEVVFTDALDDGAAPATGDEVVFTDKPDDREQTVTVNDELVFSNVDASAVFDDSEQLSQTADDDFFFGEII